MQKTCNKCETAFDFSKEDFELLDRLGPMIDGQKYSIPEPDLCTDCRLQLRWYFRNQHFFYNRTSSLSGKDIVSIYSPNKPDTVYSYDEWWGDDWDELDYGRDFDFGPKVRPFFEQFGELFQSVPKLALMQDGTSENSEYTNYGSENKNCYMAGALGSEDVYYSILSVQNKDCVDCLMFLKSEKLYECIDVNNCYNSAYLQNCQQCSDSYFLENCRNLQNCLGCKNLKNKKYHIFNKSYSKEEYERIFAEYNLHSYSGVQKFRKKFEEFKLTLPFKFAEQRLCENSSGNFLVGAKNCHNCFDVTAGGAENCRDCIIVGMNGYDIMSSSHCAGTLNYEVDGALNSERIMFCHHSRNCSDIIYGFACNNSHNAFGCVGLRRKKYCILNKQYSKKDYEKLVPQIIEHMKNTGEWGRYFPANISPFGYNETYANEYFPLSKKEAIDKGFKWSDYESPAPKVEKVINPSELPDDINDVTDDVLKYAIKCEATGKLFKLIPQELEFYRKHKLPLPRKSPYQRHLERVAQRNPYKLWDRECDKCGDGIRTSYSPERPEKVYCEKCYLSEVY